MSITRLVFAIATTAYMLIAIQFEEHDLVHEHGAPYEQYRRMVPMIIPGLRRRQPQPGEASPQTP
jgi:protein-S-isoprenylcysteine O-methyltransferase Ste14